MDLICLMGFCLESAFGLSFLDLSDYKVVVQRDSDEMGLGNNFSTMGSFMGLLVQFFSFATIGK